MNAAASARKKKEQMPTLYCAFPSCLWRTWTREGFKACPKHSEAKRTEHATPHPEGSSDRAETQSEEASPVAVPRNPREEYYDHKRLFPF